MPDRRLFSWLQSRRRALPAAVGALCALLVTAVALFAVVTPALAEEVHTSQAARAHATASTWAPLPAKPAAICLIDSGVDLQPDTSSNVIARLAVDGGTGDDVDSAKHGTRMAMIAAAPHNGWGMVGIAPGQPIVSVRAMRPGASGYYFADWYLALSICRQRADDFNIRVINLSIGRPGVLDPGPAEHLANAVAAARRRGISVVAAAGNQPGPVETPANYGPILSVAAGAADGALCSFAAGDPTQDPPADLHAPGCQLDASSVTGVPVWANGSSHATTMPSAALAQLYSFRPELTPEQGEGLVLENATPTIGGPALNIAATWRAAGLHEQLAAGEAARPAVPVEPPAEPNDQPPGDQPHPPTPTPPTPTPPAPPGDAKGPSAVAPLPGFVDIAPPSTGRARPAWPRPRVRSIRLRRGVLTITLRRLPRRATLVVSVGGRGRSARVLGWTRRARSRKARVQLRVPSAPKFATLTISGRGRERSEPLNIRPLRACPRGCQR